MKLWYQDKFTDENIFFPALNAKIPAWDIIADQDFKLTGGPIVVEEAILRFRILRSELPLNDLLIRLMMHCPSQIRVQREGRT